MRKIGSLFARIHGQTTPRGRLAIAFFGFAMLLAVASGEGAIYRLAYFLGAGVGLSYALIRFNVWRLRMRTVRQSTVAEVGGVLAETVYVRNDSPLPTGWVEVMQVTDMPGETAGEAIRLPSRGWAEWRRERRCYARGVYTLGPLVAGSSDLLGLFRVQTTQGGAVTVVVYPPVVELPLFHLPGVDLVGEERARLRIQLRSAHVSTVREYSHGDSLNLIHWPSTARYGQLMSKQFDSPGRNDVWVVLDLEQAIHECADMERTDEYGAAIAASLISLALAGEHAAGLIAYGDREYILPLGSGNEQMARAMEMLTRSRTEGETPLAEVLCQNARRLGAHVSIIVITSSTCTEWTSTLSDLASRGHNVCVVLVDPASFGAERSSDELLLELVSAGIPSYLVGRGDPLSVALSRPVTRQDLPVSEGDGAADPISDAEPVSV